MPLFDYDAPEVQRYNAGLNFEGSLFDRLTLAISGYKQDGSGRSLLGKINDIARPILGTAVGAIAGSFIGMPLQGAKLGQKFGGFRNEIDSALSRGILKGTNQEYFAQEGLEKQIGINKTIEQITDVALGGLSSFGKIGASDQKAITNATLSVPGISPAVSSAIGQSSMSDTGGLSNIFGFLKSFFKDGGILEQDFVKNQGSTELDYSFIKNKGNYSALFDSDPIENDEEVAVDTKPLEKVRNDVVNLIAQGENPYDKNLFAPYIYKKKNSVGSGHYGKYQFTPDFINKFYGGTVSEFLNDPKGQERAMRARMDTLNQEARIVMKEAGATHLDYDKARLLVHFQGLPNSIQIAKSGRFNQGTSINPSASSYFDRAYGKMLLFGGGIVNETGLLEEYEIEDKKIVREYNVDGEILKYETEQPTYVLYPDGNRQEDLFIIDKKKAEEFGVFKLLDNISKGEMRYGERVFDQDFSILMKGLLLDPTRGDEDKKRLMGAAVIQELLTHHDIYAEIGDEREYDNKYYFIDGGLNQPDKKNKKLEVLNTIPDEDTFAFQRFYNENIAAQNGLPIIKEDGIIGTETTRAINNAKSLGIDLSANVRTFADTQTGDPVIRLEGLVSSAFKAKNIQGDDFNVSTPMAFRDLFRQFNDSGYKPIERNALEDLELPTFGVSRGIFDPDLSQTGTISYADLIKKEIPKAAESITGGSSGTAGQLEKPVVAGNALEDLLGLGTGLFLSQTNLTDYDETDEYAKLRSELNNNLNQGFGADVVSNFNQNRQNSISSALNTVQNLGGTQGQALSAISNIFSSAQSGDVNFALADEQLKNQRLAQFGSFAQTDQGRSDRLTDVERAQEQALRDAGATLIGDTLQNREDRKLYDEFYGPNSTQSQLIKAQDEASKRTAKQIEALNKSLLNILKK